MTCLDQNRINKWLPYREQFLNELLRHDGLADVTDLTLCPKHKLPAKYRCQDCLGLQLQCRDCMCNHHQYIPLHRIQVWEDGFWDKSSLFDLGLELQLGHSSDPCPLPSKTSTTLLAFDTSGIHKVCIRWCECSRSHGGAQLYTQLLRVQWYPASVDRPRTVFTFDALNTFHLLTLQGKLSLYDYYNGILKKANNTGLGKEVFRWNEISVVVRQWQHIKMLKRAGRGHSSTGIEATPSGGCAVLCPACPQPGLNLPEGWDKLPLSERYHRLLLAIDGCFKLKLKARGIQDEELGSGWAYFVRDETYRAYLSTCKDDREISPCTSELNAIKQSHKKGTNSGLSVTSVLGVKCARHAFVLPNGVADLQKGERFCNVDYAVLSALKSIGADSLIETDFSFDIACSWFVNFLKRLDDMPDDLRKVAQRLIFRAFIPKAHIEGHGATCRTRYSFNFRPYVGRTHGETIEQEWAHIGPLMTSTREMGPGARHSTLDDHWGWWNWQKFVSLGKRLIKDLKEADRMSSKQRAFASQFTASFPQDVIKKWSSMIANWLIDHRKPDPFAEPEGALSLAKVRLEIAKEEAKEAVREGDQIHDKMGPSAFVRWGLDLEERQYVPNLFSDDALLTNLRRVLQKKLGSSSRSSAQEVSLQERRSIFMRHIRAWYLVHALYMPSSIPTGSPEATFLSPTAESETHAVVPIEDLKLWLPSRLDVSARSSFCLNGTADKEKRLRRAQLEDALIELRRLRRVYGSLLRKFKVQIAGTGRKATTRSQTSLRAFNSKIGLTIARYRDARIALLALDPSGEWQEQFKELRDEDNRGPNRKEDEHSEGRRQPSWIWTVYAANADISTEDEDDQLRAEWAKATARAQRWEEEKALLLEEMCRCLRFFDAKADWWDKHTSSLVDGHTPDILSGLHGYAKRQATMYRRLVASWIQLWRPVLRQLKLKEPWDKRYNFVVEEDQGRHVASKGSTRRSAPSTANMPEAVSNSSEDDTESLAFSDSSAAGTSDDDYLSD
ncbi:hypothetical protein CERSUDRAFT_60542 [Gelatoporia subvermispora B]|uniref:CxC2-like cysteine cluster KDZ transposase-associated domain-containing protein n=1 Tax=Ceriporiopsis subvermispora (strain B) TaxID=914234 RepID=M2QGA7_CERS8|nr:hypothetical protein CERSUDRAFT_60542 [Gelatoporia subvermispora B]